MNFIQFIKKSSVENNRIYTFECDFSDPFDFMKGHYLSLNIKQAQVKTSELDEETFAQLDLNKTRRIVSTLAIGGLRPC